MGPGEGATVGGSCRIRRWAAVGAGEGAGVGPGEGATVGEGVGAGGSGSGGLCRHWSRARCGGLSGPD